MIPDHGEASTSSFYASGVLGQSSSDDRCNSRCSGHAVPGIPANTLQQPPQQQHLFYMTGIPKVKRLRQPSIRPHCSRTVLNGRKWQVRTSIACGPTYHRAAWWRAYHRGLLACRSQATSLAGRSPYFLPSTRIDVIPPRPKRTAHHSRGCTMMKRMRHEGLNRWFSEGSVTPSNPA